MGILTSIFGGSRARTAPIRLLGEEGFVDLDFPLAAPLKVKGTGFQLLAQGTYEGKTLGFLAETHADWKEQLLEDESVTLYWGQVTLRSIGDPSDNFVAALSKLYGLTIDPGPMLSEITMQAVGLADDPRRIANAPARMKLFFHSESESRYAEIYLNVDARSAVVQFHEKDPEYRENVVRALHGRA